MKFTWFNLMPWPYLPDDFREKHRSVWVDIPNTLYDPRRGHHVYHTYLDQLEYAEKTLQYLQQLWGREVALETIVNGKTSLLCFADNKLTVKPES